MSMPREITIRIEGRPPTPNNHTKNHGYAYAVHARWKDTAWKAAIAAMGATFGPAMEQATMGGMTDPLRPVLAEALEAHYRAFTGDNRCNCGFVESTGNTMLAHVVDVLLDAFAPLNRVVEAAQTWKAAHDKCLITLPASPLSREVVEVFTAEGVARTDLAAAVDALGDAKEEPK